MTPTVIALKFEPPFACSRCGACCRSVSLSASTAWLANEANVCRYLDTSTEMCTIYDRRPDICRVDLQYQLHYKNDYSWTEFLDVNHECCKILQKQIQQI